MILLNRRNVCAWALGLVMASGLSGTAHAAASYSYRTVGQIAVPDGVTPGLVYFSGISSDTFTPPGSIDLGTFKVSTLAATTNATYTNTPFEIIASVGSDMASKISGVINGSFGPSATNPGLTATIKAITPYGANPLPFDVQLPIDTPLTIALSTGSSTGQTALTGAVPVPEPASVAVFAAALGGLGLWRRRAR